MLPNKESASSTHKILGAVATGIFVSWLLLVLNFRGIYDNISGIAPLGMIDVLFPYYWILLIIFIGVCFLTYRRKDSPLWLHMLLLSQLALMLYYTPFLLGGFSWSPDSLWHGGVASYMPSILSGSTYSLTQYAQSYPLSFLVTYGVESVSSLDVVTYTLYVFPPVCIALISSLAYFFSYRIFNKQIAFLAMLFALPTLHYIEPHVSPFATGTVLLLASLVLLTYKSAKTLALSVLLIVAITLTHPISPLFLGVYIAAALLVNLVSTRKGQLPKVVTVQSPVGLLSSRLVQHKFTFPHFNRNVAKYGLLLLFLCSFWLYWTMYKAAPAYAGVQTPVSNVLDLKFISNLLKSVEWTTGGQGFIYPEISQLSLYIYGLFLVATVLIFSVCAFKFFKQRGNISDSTSKLLTLTVTSLASAAVSYLLFSSSGERYLLGRGLIFFLIMGSICIAFVFAGANTKRANLKIGLAFGFVLFLICTFPIISYSKESYNTYTPSSQQGLMFLSNNINLSNETLSMASDQQLAAYVDLAKGLHLVGFPPPQSQQPDVIVMRENAYYLLAMRYDYSLTDNGYTKLDANLTDNQFYDKIYSNMKFEVFVRTY